MDFKCESCGYDLTGVARTRRTDVRCPECERDNALGVDVSCVRCGYDLSARARSNLHRVTCSECGEEDAVRPREEPEDPIHRVHVARYIFGILVSFTIMVPAIVAAHAAHVYGVAGAGRGVSGSAVAAALMQTILINVVLAIGLRAVASRAAGNCRPSRRKIVEDGPRVFNLSVLLSPVVVAIMIVAPA